MSEGLLDWRPAKVGDPHPCIVCGQPAILRHPINQGGSGSCH